MNNEEQLNGGMAAEEEVRDIVECVDEDGNTLPLEVVRYVFYNGEEYAVLGEVHDDDCDCCCEDCEHAHEDDEEEECPLYIMKVVEKVEDGEEMEEFIPVEDEALFEQLIQVVEADFAADESFDDE